MLKSKLRFYTLCPFVAPLVLSLLATSLVCYYTYRAAEKTGYWLFEKAGNLIGWLEEGL